MLKTYVVGTHQNRPNKAILMSTHGEAILMSIYYICFMKK